MYHESTRSINILFYTNKHGKIKNNCVTLDSISLLYNAQEFCLVLQSIRVIVYSTAFFQKKTKLIFENGSLKSHKNAFPGNF